MAEKLRARPRSVNCPTTAVCGQLRERRGPMSSHRQRLPYHDTIHDQAFLFILARTHTASEKAKRERPRCAAVQRSEVWARHRSTCKGGTPKQAEDAALCRHLPESDLHLPRLARSLIQLQAARPSHCLLASFISPASPAVLLPSPSHPAACHHRISAS